MFSRLCLLAVVSSLLLAAGCARQQRVVAPASDNMLRLPMTANPTTFDPAIVQDGTTIDMLQNMYDGLVQWTPQNTLAPSLAEKWEVSPDGRTYTFHLRSGVKFQDGNPVTAQDVYYSLRRTLDPKLQSPVAINYLGDIVGAKELNSGKIKDLTGVKVINPQTVAITITQPKAYWIYTLTYPTAYVVSKAEADKAQGPNGQMTDADAEAGAGTGPFRVTRYAKDSQVEMSANPNYWQGAPKIAGQRRLIVKDANTRRSLYLGGQLDIVDEPKDALDADAKNPALKDQVTFWKRASTFYIGLNQKAFPPFKDVRVRQALAYATDKNKIRDIVLHNNLDVAQDILPEGLPGYDPNFQGIPYDPAKGRALLAQAGYPGGKGLPPIPIYYRESYPDLDATVDLIRQMWQKDLGVTVEGRVTEWSVLLAKEDQNVLPCYHIRWAADYLDPQDYYSLLFRTGAPENHTGYS
nr:peptide ABC transporter substrate-binding protein [Armatimonadota bacterium]